MAPRMAQKLAAGGCLLVSLLPKHVKDWWPIIEDIFCSQRIKAVREALVMEALRHEEFVALSVDATMRCCLSVLGQAHPRACRSDRLQAAFDDASSKRRVARPYVGVIYFCFFDDVSESKSNAPVLFHSLHFSHGVASGTYCPRKDERFASHDRYQL